MVQVTGRADQPTMSFFHDEDALDADRPILSGIQQQLVSAPLTVQALLGPKDLIGAALNVAGIAGKVDPFLTALDGTQEVPTPTFLVRSDSSVVTGAPPAERGPCCGVCMRARMRRPPSRGCRQQHLTLCSCPSALEPLQAPSPPGASG